VVSRPPAARRKPKASTEAPTLEKNSRLTELGSQELFGAIEGEKGHTDNKKADVQIAGSSDCPRKQPKRMAPFISTECPEEKR